MRQRGVRVQVELAEQLRKQMQHQEKELLLAIRKEAGVDIVLYPLTAFRAMSQSAENVYNSDIKDGTQESLLDIMQTREELYEVLDYYNFEKELDNKLSKE